MAIQSSMYTRNRNNFHNFGLVLSYKCEMNDVSALSTAVYAENLETLRFVPTKNFFSFIRFTENKKSTFCSELIFRPVT